MNIQHDWYNHQDNQNINDLKKLVEETSKGQEFPPCPPPPSGDGDEVEMGDYEFLIAGN